MQKILFCYFHPQSNQNYTPLDVGYIAALIRTHFPQKFEVEIVPLTFISGQRSPDFRVGEDVADIVSFQPDAVFFFLDNVLWFNVFALGRAKKLITALKNKNQNIFVGLQSHKFRAQEILEVLKSGLVDCIVGNDPENSFRGFDKIIKKEKVPGVAYFSRREGRIITYKEEDARVRENLDYLPSPYLEGIFDEFLKKKQVEFDGKLMAYLYFSRGCPFACYYCFRSTKYDKRISAFSAERFYDEIEYLLNKFDIKSFFILDDSFLSAELKTDEFLNEFEKRKKENHRMNEISLSVMVRPELLNEKNVLFLKKINVQWVQIGLQSVNPNLQKYINRSFSLENFKRISNLLHSAGVRMHLDIIMGLPDDTLDYFKKTMEYALILDPYSIQVKQFYLNPETLFFERREEYQIKARARRNGYFVPFVYEARGISDEYFTEATEYVKKKMEEFPEVKWKLATADIYQVSEGWWSFL